MQNNEGNKMNLHRVWMCAVLCVLVVAFTGCAAFGDSRNGFVGGYSKVPITDEEVIAAAKYAVDEQSKREAEHLQLVRIRSSEQQVVAGMNYQLVLAVKKGTKERAAKATVYKDLKFHLSLTAWEWITDKP
jgi:hypothetical protein